jgi:hypothetical protein
MEKSLTCRPLCPGPWSSYLLECSPEDSDSRLFRLSNWALEMTAWPKDVPGMDGREFYSSNKPLSATRHFSRLWLLTGTISLHPSQHLLLQPSSLQQSELQHSAFALDGATEVNIDRETAILQEIKSSVTEQVSGRLHSPDPGSNSRHKTWPQCYSHSLEKFQGTLGWSLKIKMSDQRFLLPPRHQGHESFTI